MGKSGAVWGIDIGQCALKALKCRPGDDDGHIIAEAFDYIEYPKILSQPDADQAELVREALATFMSRNVVKGDRVAISVSGQSGLARFIKLPPVESKKIPDIVKYEAKQQIPFALEDVVWDYQQMAGGSEEDGFALETEVGLFAMKRDQVFRALKPFEEAGIEVDVVQLTPLTIYNYTVFDQMQELPPPDQYDPDNPPESVVCLSLGTDTTDLVVTNGYRVWQRSVPLGGSHFTKALMKELKLTFAKAEHLKKHATQAEDPKAVFQAMRPVFNDLLTEIQRSIGYFTSIDRKAKIGRVVALGNAMKLPGLQKYLSQNLGYPVSEVQKYRGITGDAVVGAPAFKDNQLSYAVCYGLVLQGMAQSKLSTNLLPREMVTDRLIRDKKPWAVAMVGTLLLGCTVSFFGHYRAWNSVAKANFDKAISAADSAVSNAKSEQSQFDTAKAAFDRVVKIGDSLAGNVDGRLQWLELVSAVIQCFPSDPPDQRPNDIEMRRELHILEMNNDWLDDLGSWYTGAGIAEKVKQLEAEYPAASVTAPPPSEVPAADAATGDGQPDGAPAPPAAPAQEAAPTGPGWIVSLRGYHYYNKDAELGGYNLLRDTLIKDLHDKKVQLPDASGKLTQVSVSEMGISNATLVSKVERAKTEEIDDPNVKFGETPRKIKLRRFEFEVQFAWKPTSAAERQEKAKAAAQPGALAEGGAR